ncbi:MAG TPA: MerR family transcriptional regulator [Clostridia bacterium]|nr:MerR family transcriptional regulator [Clostridia bacterium]
MYKIGEFSTLSKTTVKALRYYEKKGILSPEFINENGYRYYSSKQLTEIAKIVHLKQSGLSIEEIKKVISGCDFKQMLLGKKIEVEKMLIEYQHQLAKINYLLEDQNMKYEVIVKELPECIVYYKEGRIRDFSQAIDFIVSSAEECKSTNPDIKCAEPDYCFVNYTDGEFRPVDIGYRYCQAVTKEGIPNDIIKFKKLDKVKAVCIYHKGSYDLLREAYAFVLKYVEDNGYRIIDLPRERFIDGMWNKEDTKDWLTEIQVPVE